MKLNFGYGAACLLLFSSWLMMIISVAMPDWSNNTSNGGLGIARVGLYNACARVPDVDWTCIGIPDPVASNGYMVTCRVCSIFGLVLTFLANVAVYAAMMSPKAGIPALVLCILSFILLSISWGMWIGVHGEYFSDVLDLASSFIMTCVSSGFTMLSICCCVAGVVQARNGKQADDAERGAPGLEDQAKEAAEPGYMTPYPDPELAYPSEDAPAFADPEPTPIHTPH